MLAAEIGVLLLLFSLGLEYTESELRNGLRTGVPPGCSTWLRTRAPAWHSDSSWDGSRSPPCCSAA